jgi:hypothetical protein
MIGTRKVNLSYLPCSYILQGHVFLPGCSFFNDNTTPSIMGETEQAESDSSLHAKMAEILHC